MTNDEIKKKYVEYRLRQEKSNWVQTDATPYIESYEKDFERDADFITEMVEGELRGFVEYFETHKWHRYSTSIFLHEALEEYLKEQNI